MNFLSIKSISTGVLAFVLLLIGFGSFEVINPDERAVKVTTGEIQPGDYGPGVQFKVPFFQHFETASNEPITTDVQISTGADGAVSKDNQTIGLVAITAYNYDNSQVATLVSKYPNRSVLERLVNSTTYEALKAEIGKYTIFELAQSVDKITKAARVASAEKLKDFPVNVTQINITNWDWSDDFDAQIKATMNTQQKVAQAKAEADRVEQVARQKTIEAEATAKALVATAEGDKQAALLRADAKRAEGAGIADYNKSIAQNLETELKFRELEIDKIREERRVYVSQYIPLTAAGGIVTMPSAVAK